MFFGKNEQSKAFSEGYEYVVRGSNPNSKASDNALDNYGSYVDGQMARINHEKANTQQQQQN